jgi:hypothetical protein
LLPFIDKYGTKEIAVPFLSSQETQTAAAALEQKPQLIASMIPKLMDPSTAAREGEVEAARNLILSMGAGTDPGKAAEALRFVKNFMHRHIKARQMAREGFGAEEIAKAVGGTRYLPGQDSSDWRSGSAPPATQSAQPEVPFSYIKKRSAQ